MPIGKGYPPEFSSRLDHCWICKTRLADAGGDPLFLRNQHHVFPRAFGGSDGPTVSLDTAHHDLLHLVANHMMSGKDWTPLLERMEHSSKQRLLYLSTRVVEAAELFNNDPNKRITKHFTLSRKEAKAFDEMTRFHRVSSDTLIRRLLAQEYRRLFPSR